MNPKNCFFERHFKLREHNTSIRTEFVAGLTTFMTMAYILAVNPSILSASGMDWGGVFTATVIASVIGTLAMAFLANYPFALAPGMGLNAFFTYYVVFQLKQSWQFALTAVFLEGIIFLVLSLFNVRETIFNSIPANLKKAVSAGIGLFIALIGLSGSGVVSGANPDVILQLGNLEAPSALLTLIGIILIGVLMAFKVRGALLLGILGTTILGIPLGVTKLPALSELLPTLPHSIAPVFFKMEWSDIFSWNMLLVVFSFLFVDIFDTIGTLVGVSSKAGMLDKDHRLPRVKQALLADAIATTAGAALGTSTVTTYVESSAGVAAGGRTGLSSFFTAIFFFAALFFAPVFQIIPAAATAPALIIVGLLMISSLKDVDFGDITEALPAFLTMIMMPFTYSIAEGIVFGMVSYVVLKLLTGKVKDISVTMFVLSVLFVLKYLLLPKF